MSLQDLLKDAGVQTIPKLRGLERLVADATPISERLMAAQREQEVFEFESEVANRPSTIFKETLGGVRDVFTNAYNITREIQKAAPGKIKEDISEAAKNFQKGQFIRGQYKAEGRVAGDVANLLFAPLSGAVGAVLQANGGQKLTDDAGQYIADKSGITDWPAFQRFAMSHPNAAEDFNRLAILALTPLETGTIEPRTAIPRTRIQITELTKRFAREVVMPKPEPTGLRRLIVESQAGERQVPLSTPKTRLAKYSQEQGYERYVSPEKLPVIPMGERTKTVGPVIQMDTPVRKGEFIYEPVTEGPDEFATELRKFGYGEEDIKGIQKIVDKMPDDMGNTPAQEQLWEDKYMERYTLLGDEVQAISNKASKAPKAERPSLYKKADVLNKQIGKLEEDFISEAKKLEKGTSKIPKPDKGYTRYSIVVNGEKLFADYNPNYVKGGSPIHVAFRGPKDNAISETGYKSQFIMGTEKELGITKKNIQSELQKLGQALADENSKSKGKNKKTKVISKPVKTLETPVPKAGKKIQQTEIIPVEESATPQSPSIGTVKQTTVEGTGETQVRGLARGIEEKAIENKLVKTLGDLPEYETLNMKDQARLAAELLANDLEYAKRIAMGREQPPAGLTPEAVLVALEDYAINVKDVELLKQLGTESGLLEEATTMGQRIRILAERDPESPVKAIGEVVKVRKARAKIKDIPKAKREVMNEIRTEINKGSPKRDSWKGFIDSIEC